MHNYDRRIASNQLETKLAEIRRRSEAAWEQASDDPRDDSDAKAFTKDWDAWGESWDDAETEIERGEFRTALKSLENCAYREKEYGSDEHARAALKVLEKMGPKYDDGELAEDGDRVRGGDGDDEDEGKIFKIKSNGDCMVAWESGVKTPAETSDLSRI